MFLRDKNWKKQRRDSSKLELWEHYGKTFLKRFLKNVPYCTGTCFQVSVELL